MKKIAAIIVTFNRKELLAKCVEAVLGQSCLPETIFVIDNASTDGTGELLLAKEMHHGLINSVTIHYERLPQNIGGAGGFHAGMKLAHEAGFDAVWMMDDDGLPDKDCLKNLVPYLDRYDYLSPLVVDIENDKMMSFEGCTVDEFLKREKNGIVAGCANPFNGILYSKKLINTIGYPKKEMFIWGDEINFDLRAKAAGFHPVMVVNAIHRHPLNRQRYVSYLGRHKVVVPAEDWKLFCNIRNRTYNNVIFFGKRTCILNMSSEFAKFLCYYLLKVHQPSKILIVVSAMYKGFVGDFTGLEKWLK